MVIHGVKKLLLLMLLMLLMLLTCLMLILLLFLVLCVRKVRWSICGLLVGVQKRGVERLRGLPYRVL